MLCAQVKNQAVDFVMRERIAEGRHVLAAIFDLGFDGMGAHRLPDIGEGRSFGGSEKVHPVTEGAALVAKEDRTLGFSVFS